MWLGLDAEFAGTKPRTLSVVPVAVGVPKALLGVVTWWLDHDASYSVEQIAAMFERLTTPALEAGWDGSGKDGYDNVPAYG